MHLPTASLFFLLPALVRSQLLTATSPPPTTTTALPTPQPPSLLSNYIAITSFLPFPPPLASPTPDALPPSELKRQAAGVGAAGGSANSPSAAQEPAVTSWYEWSSVPGSNTWTSLNFVYTQLFSPVPQQLPTASSGDVGMGSLTGVVGTVKTDEVRSMAGGRRRGKGRGWRLVGVVAAVVVLMVG